MNLKPLRKRLEEITKKTGLRLDVVQQDYILSWLLVGIFQHPQLKSNLIFKGGTALKKGYFGEYRFSEDLDFSIRHKVSTSLFAAFKTACKNAEKQMREFAPIQMNIKKYTEKQPHPHGQEAFTISAQFPWQSQPLTKAMIEVSQDETILLNPTTKRLLHYYGEPFELDMTIYSLEEIVLEKLRAILQHTKKLHERDWTRSRARDYYDLWRILRTFEKCLNLKLIRCLLPLKCFKKEVSFKGVEDFFDEKMIANVKRTWNQWLGPLVPDFPNCELVLNELKDRIGSMTNFVNPRHVLGELIRNCSLKNTDRHQTCEKAIQAGADVNHSIEGLTPFELAVIEGDKALADLMLSHGGRKIRPPGLGYVNYYNMYKE